MRSYSGAGRTNLIARMVATYGNVCHLCHEPIDLALKFPDPQSLSADHLVPQSRGGSHTLANVRPAHLRCNASRQDKPLRQGTFIDNREWFTTPTQHKHQQRRVVLICGAPGSGKTTLAQRMADTENLHLYDIDNPEYAGDEQLFKKDLAHLAQDPTARAIVIRAGATRLARAKLQDQLNLTQTIVLKTPPATCKERIKQRGRARPPLPQQLAAVDTWYRAYEP